MNVQGLKAGQMPLQLQGMQGLQSIANLQAFQGLQGLQTINGGQFQGQILGSPLTGVQGLQTVTLNAQGALTAVPVGSSTQVVGGMTLSSQPSLQPLTIGANGIITGRFMFILWILQCAIIY